jgi:hypothetical protein
VVEFDSAEESVPVRGGGEKTGVSTKVREEVDVLAVGEYWKVVTLELLEGEVGRVFWVEFVIRLSCIVFDICVDGFCLQGKMIICPRVL